MEIDDEKIDEAVLALLYLGRYGGDRWPYVTSAWKGFDWSAMGRLHQKGHISNPVGKARSVMFTADGLREAERAFNRLFGDA